MPGAAAIAFIAFACAQSAIGAQPHKDEVPALLSGPIRGTLSPGGVRATLGTVQLDFWFVKALPMKARGAISWGAVEEGALVGAVRLGSEFRDIRGRLIKPGVYTLRFGLQPQNGDHLGVSPYREFLMLSPAEIDTDPGAKGHEPTIEMSIKTAGGSHPAIWSIDPPTASAEALTNHTTELGHTAVIFAVPVSHPDADGATLRFGIVLIGRIDA